MFEVPTNSSEIISVIVMAEYIKKIGELFQDAQDT